MRKTAAFIGAGLLALGAVGMTACAGGGGSAAAGGSTSTLVLAESVPATPWDLAKASMGPETQYYQPVFDTLVRLDPKGNPTPNLATSWSYDTAQTTLTLKLRGGVTFTDGSALTAQVVKDNLLHTRSGTGSAATEMQDITGVDAVATDTVAIRLDHPSSSLLSTLGQVSGMIASPKALTDPRTPVGSGPYRLDTSASTGGQQYTYVRNAGYWNTKAFPYDRIVIKYLADPTARVNALLSGQIDGTLASPQKAAAVRGGGRNVVTYQAGDVAGLFIWDRAGKQVPALGNVTVRQALNYAIDRQAVIKNISLGLGTATSQLFADGDEAYDSALDAKYPYDPAKARQLLAEAGYPNGFSVTMPDLSALFPQQQALLTQWLKDVGIKVTLENLPSNQIFSALLAGKYPMSYFKLGAPTSWEKIQLQLTKSSTWNPLKYDDPTADSLVAGIQSSTGAQRTALMKQLNAYVVDQAWNAPWNVVPYVYATSRDVQVVPQAGATYPSIYNFSPAR